MSLKKAAPWFVVIGVLLGVSVGTAKYKSIQTEQVEYTNPIARAYGSFEYRRYKALTIGKNASLMNAPAGCELQGVEFIKVNLYSRTQDGKYSVEDGKCEIYETEFKWLTNKIEKQAIDADEQR